MIFIAMAKAWTMKIILQFVFHFKTLCNKTLGAAEQQAKKSLFRLG